MARKLKLRIWRGDATDGGLKNVEVEANEGEVVLDLIHRVQATQMGDLAVRWNCKAGKCGSCSMEINGKPRLACMTQVASFPEGEEITVTPLRAFPVIKDLVKFSVENDDILIRLATIGQRFVAMEYKGTNDGGLLSDKEKEDLLVELEKISKDVQAKTMDKVDDIEYELEEIQRKLEQTKK